MTPFENTRVRHLREAADQALTTASKTVARMSEQQWKDNGVEVVWYFQRAIPASTRA